MNSNRGQWSTKLGFILSSAGAAIGLGAIWKMPYVTGQSGGGAFFLIFVCLTLLIGLPMLISEFIIGRGAGEEAITAYKKLVPQSAWVWIGRLGVVGCFLLLSFYSVVGGWILVYSGMSVVGNVITDNTSSDVLFGTIIGTPWITLVGLLVFTILNVWVISSGVQNGIEKANKLMMPLLFIFFFILVIRSLTLDGAMEGVKFFLSPDFSKTTGESILYALGQSFFALAVGFSCMVTYSSYLKKDVSLPYSAGSVVIMNIFVSLLAGLAIFPVVFAFGYEPAEGPGLLFIVLPTVFGQMPFGEVFLALFLILFLFATLTSSFSMYEIIVAALMEKWKNARKGITWIIGGIIFVASIPSALSSSLLKDVTIFQKSVFDATDFLVSNMMLPFGNLLIAIFIIHRMNKVLVEEEFKLSSTLAPGYYTAWRFLMTWMVPVVIVVVLIYSLRPILGG
ncbi:sodium-dependent transporter [Psychrobacillus sp. NEAU-3TGS]|uniref:sodium-dependent transporter n=1 Tax=Psychrobacillus sp. NEAU-3TGS TaxID=2995412 RepID=UPI0024999F20|nr:sodium-dependent transporter [Psychrobacillus sp. NEAU-3TGS]MDI2586970.1 sodium-dependent transporter [Psychrobacillus sp. NEAU-3TGS]